MLNIDLSPGLKVSYNYWSLVFAAWFYASAVYDVVVCLSVCLSQASIVSKWINVELHKPYPQDNPNVTKIFVKFECLNPQLGCQMQVG